ncbi:hypothetical protein AB4Y89_00765 [Terriglobus sp. 2YAB30_2]|uniref:hypothetical protein n=1 Tax=unclassified Terriglobus TaxID=2628988 RepID=UPI003F983B0F
MALGRTATEATQRFVLGQYRFEVLRVCFYWLQDEAPEMIGELKRQDWLDLIASRGLHRKALLAAQVPLGD